MHDLARRERARRATDRARAVLKPGDRLRVTRCGGGLSTVTFKGFDPIFSNWITSATRDDIHALHITKVNGVPTSFADPEDFAPPAISWRKRVRHWLNVRSMRFRHWRAIHLPSVRTFRNHDLPWMPDGAGISISWHGHTLEFLYRQPDDVPF